jgi:hypothetical protein
LLRDHQIKMKYMKVVELTKKGQPHLHLVAAGMPCGRVTRCRGHKNERAWVEGGCFQAGESCLLHIVSKTWLAVSGDSWVCDVSPVRSGPAAGRYISKYVGKWDQGKMLKLGFKRKWSATQGFTPDLHLRLRGTVEKQWIKTEHWDYQKDAKHWLLASRDDRLLEIVGHPIVMEKYEMRQRRKIKQFCEELINNATYLEAMDIDESQDVGDVVITPESAPGLIDVEGLFGPDLQGSQEFFSRMKMLSTVNAGRNFNSGDSTVTLTDLVHTKVRFGNKYKVDGMHTGMVGFSNPQMTNTINTIPYTPTEKEWLILSYIDSFVDEMQAYAIGISGGTNVDPYQDVSAYIAELLVGSPLEDSAGAWNDTQYRVFTKATWDISLIDRRKINVLSG